MISLFRFSLLSVRTVCYNSVINVGRSYYNVGDFVISDCSFFRSGTLSGYGGVVLISMVSSSMTVKDSMFVGCHVDGWGGAIYFNCTGLGESLISRVCSYNCSAYASCFSFTHVSPFRMNDHCYVSVVRSGSPTSYRPISPGYGNIGITYSNISLSTAYAVSGMRVDSTNSFTCMFCTFAHNFAAFETCIRVLNVSGTISFCNIAHNNSPQSGVITLHDGSNLLIESCIIYGNTDSLSFVFSSSICFNNSKISHNGFQPAGNNQYSKYPSLEIPHFRSHYCHADIYITKENKYLVRFQLFGIMLFLK